MAHCAYGDGASGGQVVWPRDRGVRVHRSGSELGLYMRLVGEEDERGAERDCQRCTANQTSPRARRTRAKPHGRWPVRPPVTWVDGRRAAALYRAALGIDTRVQQLHAHSRSSRLQKYGLVAGLYDDGCRLARAQLQPRGLGPAPEARGGVTRNN